MLLHFMISFKLICNVLRKLNFDILTPTTGSGGGGGVRGWVGVCRQKIWGPQHDHVISKSVTVIMRLTSWLSFVVSTVSLSLSHWYPGSGVVLDCIDS